MRWVRENGEGRWGFSEIIIYLCIKQAAPQQFKRSLTAFDLRCFCIKQAAPQQFKRCLTAFGLHCLCK